MAEPATEADREETSGFWTISSFRVQVNGHVATASDSFVVPKRKAADEDTPGGDGGTSEESGEAYAESCRRVLDYDDQPFPWEVATAVSDKVFEEGVHEFLVEVGGTGMLGFCEASFTEKRAMIGKHWMNEENVNRVWILHSTGHFANGNVLSENEPNARFTAGDRILIKLDLFKETAEYFRDSGASSGGGEPRYLGMNSGICIPVRLGFQMFKTSTAITLLEYRDLTDTIPPRERAEAFLIRGDALYERADKVLPSSKALAHDRARVFGDAMRTLDEAARAFSALQDSAKTNVALEKWNQAKKLKKEAEELKF